MKTKNRILLLTNCTESNWKIGIKMNQAISTVWNGFRRTRAIPLLLVTVVMGGLFLLFLLGGAKALLSGNGWGSLLLGLFGIIFAISVALAWWRTQKDLRGMEMDNTWVAIVVGISMTLSVYAEYGPGGHYIKEAGAELPALTLKWINPTLSSVLDQYKASQRATQN